MRTQYGRIYDGEKWIRWRIQFAHVDRLCWILVCAISLAGCGERSQELDERVTRLQKELNRTQDELRSTKQALDATNEELTRLKAASTNASTAGPVAPNNASAPASGASASGNQQQPPQQPVSRSAGLPADRSVTIQWPDSGRPPVPANQNLVANPATGVKCDRPLGSNCHHSMARGRAIAASAKLKQCASRRIAPRREESLSPKSAAG